MAVAGIPQPSPVTAADVAVGSGSSALRLDRDFLSAKVSADQVGLTVELQLNRDFLSLKVDVQLTP
jgi:hypothetical protein